MKDLTREQLISNQKAQELQRQIEAKSQSELINEKNTEKKIQDKLNLELNKLNRKTESLKVAIKQANYNKSKAATLLNVDRKTLYNKMRQFKEFNMD